MARCHSALVDKNHKRCVNQGSHRAERGVNQHRRDVTNLTERKTAYTTLCSGVNRAQPTSYYLSSMTIVVFGRCTRTTGHCG
jgi:hypothetical protein